MNRIEKMYPLIFNIIMIVMGALGAHSIKNQDWSSLFVIIQAIAIVWIPYVLEKKFSIHTPYILRLGFLLFMFSTLILGEIANLYNMLWWWDVALHVVSSAGIAIIGFIIITLIYKDRDMKAAPWLTTFLVFSFAMALAVVWEIYEFLIDLFFETDTPMQLGNTDTMTDLIVAVMGAIIVCAYGFDYIKRQRTITVIAATIEEGKVNNL